MPDKAEIIRIGIIGAGTNTKAMHIPKLKAIKGVEIVSVANRTLASSEKAAAEFSIPQVYESWHQLVEADDTDAIVIGTWPYMHCPITLAALAAGKHVMCEARMASNAAEARAMYKASQQHPKLITQVVPSPFTLSADETIKRMLAEGYLGEILAVEVRSISGEFLDPKSPLQWRQDYELSGVNTLSLGIWYEAIMRWLGQAVSVSAMGKVFAKTRHDNQTRRLKAVQIPEHLVVNADMACGAQATMLFSAVMGTAAANEATIYGSQGTIRFADQQLYAAKYGDKQLSKVEIPADEHRQWRVEEEFINAIRGTEKITLTTFQDGVKYMEFTQAVQQSTRQGKTIMLPLPQ